MKYKNTKLEAEGAEFLVLGNLLINKIASYKTYTNMPGYDLVATNAELNTSAKIQVKSRWTQKAGGFLISRFDCDFVVFVRLNLDGATSENKSADVDYYVFPAAVLKKIYRRGKMPKVVLKDIPNHKNYKNKWNLISAFLSQSAS